MEFSERDCGAHMVVKSGFYREQGYVFLFCHLSNVILMNIILIVPSLQMTLYSHALIHMAVLELQCLEGSLIFHLLGGGQHITIAFPSPNITNSISSSVPTKPENQDKTFDM
jgi:hypothetical protein